jgi:anti-sigma-K factor RskA
MNDSTHRATAASEEQASLYVLNLLDANDRQHFEAQLRRDADLRGMVQRFQAGLEFEVFAETPPPAPARIWAKILERTRMDGAQVLVFPRPLYRWVQRMSAVAACLAVGALLHSWWLTTRHSSVGWFGHSGPQSSTRSGAAAPASDPHQQTVSGVVATVPKAARLSTNDLGIASNAGPNTWTNAEAMNSDSEHPLEAANALLQGKIRALNAQLADLTHSLNQAMVIPSGVSRLHVFSLGQQEPPTGIPHNLSDGFGRTNSLAESLARMAGERMALVLSSSAGSGLASDGVGRYESPNLAGTPGASEVEPVGKVALVPAQPAPVETATSGLPNLTASAVADPIFASRSVARSISAGVSPIVFSAPDAGLYAVAVPTAPTAGQYQLWSRAADGTLSSLGVLTPSSSPVSVVTFERGSADGLFMSLEPVGGSLQPSGPVVGAQNPVLPGLGRP